MQNLREPFGTRGIDRKNFLTKVRFVQNSVRTLKASRFTPRWPWLLVFCKGGNHGHKPFKDSRS